MLPTPWKRDRASDTSMTRLRSEMDRVFDRFFEPVMWGGREFQGAGQWLPAVDVKDRENEVTVCAELPGLKPEDIEISLSGSTLHICGRRDEEREDTGAGYYTKERRFGSFARSIELPVEADVEKVTAEYSDGELTVHVPKSGTQRPRRIPVNGSGARAAGAPGVAEQGNPPKSANTGVPVQGNAGARR
jgi:HSP20 family protein